MKGKAAAGNQMVLAELGLGGHTAQNWASHTVPFAHARVCRKMTLCMQGQERQETAKGEKPPGGGLRKDATAKSRGVLIFILFIYFYWQKVGM